MNTVRCAVRKILVEALPEELVRQNLLNQMIESLGYPPGYLVVEKELKQMPHLQRSHQKIPDRRADIICYAKGIHPTEDLYPLLLIECKAVPLTSKVVNQVSGYNHFLKAYFIAIANQNEVKTGWYDVSTNHYQFVSYLPSYQDLVNSVIAKS